MMEPDVRMKSKVNARYRTRAERRIHCQRTTLTVIRYLNYHFGNGGTLAELKNEGDIESRPKVPGQHGSISIVRLPIPATEDGLFVIKDLGPAIGKDPKGNDIYAQQARDLWAEGCAMSFIGFNTQIPVPWVYSICAPEQKNPEHSFIAMEYIEGAMYHANMRLTDNQKNNIIRQMATIRINMLELTSRLIGGLDWPLQGKGLGLNKTTRDSTHVVGEIAGPRVWQEGRHLVRNPAIANPGPYATIGDFVTSSLNRELAYYAMYPELTILPKDSPVNPTGWKKYAAGLVEQVRDHRFSEEDQFHLNHGDLVEGNNVVLRDGKVAAIVDWETASFLPFSESIAELLPDIEAILGNETESVKFMGGSDVTGKQMPGTAHPRYEDWIKYMEGRFGDLGSGRAWPLANGESPLMPLANRQRLSAPELEDPSSEYSDGDETEEVEEVGADWWETVAVPNMWRLVEGHITEYGINTVPYPPGKMMWPDPVVHTVGLGYLDPQERLFIAED